MQLTQTRRSSGARELLRRARGKIGESDAEFLLGTLLERARHELYASDVDVAEAVRTRYEELVARAAQGVPVEYLLHRARFMDFSVEVDARVLIPRSETEELVSRALARFTSSARVQELKNPGAELSAATCLDLGTGSGVIALAVARLLPRARVVASDCSQDALDVATRNVAALGLSERIELVRSELFAGLCGRKFDLIVSNPPYVPTGRWATLDRSVRDCEPRLALDAGEDGMSCLRVILADADAFLNAAGLLALEIDPAVFAEVRRVAPAAEIELDWQGRERYAFRRRRAGAE